MKYVMERKYSSIIIKFNWIFNTSEVILSKVLRIPSISHWIEAPSKDFMLIWAKKL
jgi:hypothetical protein